MGLRSLIRKTALYQRYKAKRESKMSDEEYFIKRHKKIFGYTPDFRNPKTFNEKIIHRILFDRSPIYTALADKLKARIYIAYMLNDFETKDNNIATSYTNTKDNHAHNTNSTINNHIYNHGGGGGATL